MDFSGSLRLGDELGLNRVGDEAGVMSPHELIVHGTTLLAGDALSPFDVGSRLDEVLLSALAVSKSAKYGTPRGAFKAMASGIGTDVP